MIYFGALFVIFSNWTKIIGIAKDKTKIIITTKINIEKKLDIALGINELNLWFIGPKRYAIIKARTNG